MLIAELATISAAWLVLSLLFCGLGAVFRRLVRPSVLEPTDLFLDWWMGWALCVAFLLAWHLFLPITPWAYLPLGIAGAAGASMEWKSWQVALRAMEREWGWLAVLILLACVAIASQTLGPERQYDTAYYHRQSVRWAQAYPAVPGLAYLNPHFAKNSSFFLFAALVDRVEILGRSLRIATGLLFLPPIVNGIVRAHEAIINRIRIDLSAWFQLLMLPVVLWQSRRYAAGLSPDGVVFVLAVVLSAELLRLLTRNGAGSEQSKTPVSSDYRVFAIVVLAVIGVTVKLSFAFFAVATVGVALWSGTRTVSMILLARMAVSTIVITALWMAHGVIVSGYVAYPLSVGSFPVEWRLPKAMVQYEADWIAAWARRPRIRPELLAGEYPWFHGWLVYTPRDRDVIGVATALLLAAGLYVRGRRTGAKSASSLPRMSTFLLPSFVAVGAWFATAPAIRFIIGPLWVIGVATLAWALARLNLPPPSGTRAGHSTHGLLLAMFGAALAIGIHESIAAQPSFAITRTTTRSGLTVYYPVADDRCGDAPLPCSNLRPDDRLELRQPGSMAKGFRLVK